MASWLNCPRCNLAREADDERLTRPVYCEQCGALLWQGNVAEQPLPAVGDDSPAPTYRLKLMPAEPADMEPIELPRPRPSVVFLEPEPRGPSLVPILCTLLALMGVGYVAFVGIMAVKSSRDASPKYTTKTSTPTNSTPPPTVAQRRTSKATPPTTLATRRDPDAATPPPPRPRSPEPSSPTPAVRRELPRGGRPTAAKEGVTWATDELTVYLQRSGLAFSVTERFNKPDDDVWIVSKQGTRIESVMITRHPTPAEATSSAKSDPGKSYAWGRFLLWGEPSDFYRKVRAALAD
jgi:hypothetical protein